MRPKGIKSYGSEYRHHQVARGIRQGAVRAERGAVTTLGSERTKRLFCEGFSQEFSHREERNQVYEYLIGSCLNVQGLVVRLPCFKLWHMVVVGGGHFLRQSN